MARRKKQTDEDKPMPSEALFETDFLRDHWDEIGLHCGLILHAQHEVKLKANLLEGVDPVDHALGMGAWGVAYPLQGTERFVVKLTLDPFEAPIWQRFIDDAQLIGHPGITYTPCVAFVPPKRAIRIPQGYAFPAGDYTLHAIVREAIKPTTESERKVWEAELDDLRSWAATVEAAKGSKRALAIAHWHAKIDEVAALYPEMTLACGFMRRAYRIARIVLADVHFENVGWAAYDMHETADYDFVRNDVVGLYPGQLKIFDPGHSSLTQAERRALERKIPPNPGIPPLRRR